MPDGYDIKVENKLLMERRGINIYHHTTRSAYIISHDSSIKIPLGKAEEGDYLHISIVRGTGNLLRDCLLNIPSWAEFEFSLEGKVSINRSGDRTILKIPAGPQTWQLKMTRSAEICNEQKPDHITISDEVSNGGSL